MTKWLAKFRFEAVNRLLEGTMASTQINLYGAKTQLSSLVKRAANGEEIIIAKAGKPTARLTALAVPDLEAEPSSPRIYREFGKGLLGVIFLSGDWEEDIPPEYFQDDVEANPFGEPADADVATVVLSK